MGQLPTTSFGREKPVNERPRFLLTSNSYPPFMYTETGRELVNQLWDETLQELSFASLDAVREPRK